MSTALQRNDRPSASCKLHLPCKCHLQATNRMLGLSCRTKLSEQKPSLSLQVLATASVGASRAASSSAHSSSAATAPLASAPRGALVQSTLQQAFASQPCVPDRCFLGRDVRSLAEHARLLSALQPLCAPLPALLPPCELLLRHHKQHRQLLLPTCRLMMMLMNSVRSMLATRFSSNSFITVLQSFRQARASVTCRRLQRSLSRARNSLELAVRCNL
jgi:hypothetical protein